MAKEWAKSFYNSALWKKQRDYILKRDHFTCTQPGCHRPATEVHHIIELNESNVNDINICLNESNLRSLCHACHDSITKQMKSKGAGILDEIYFDENGYPISEKDLTAGMKQ